MVQVAMLSRKYQYPSYFSLYMYKIVFLPCYFSMYMSPTLIAQTIYFHARLNNTDVKAPLSYLTTFPFPLSIS